jgi:hypothetical protein
MSKKVVEGLRGIRYFGVQRATSQKLLTGCIVHEFVYKGPSEKNRHPPLINAFDGFYAFNDRGIKFNDDPRRYSVIGIVEADGPTRVGEKGWRSQGIHIKQLIVGAGVWLDCQIEFWKDRYQCEVIQTFHMSELPLLGCVDLYNRDLLEGVLELPLASRMRWYLWHTRDNRELRVKDIPDGHLINIYHFCLSHNIPHTAISLEYRHRITPMDSTPEKEI